MAGFRFRVAFQVREQASAPLRKVEFHFETFRQARSNYKAILLGFYLKRPPFTFEICLNRMADAPWINPIHRESNREDGRLSG